ALESRTTTGKLLLKI
ncbi:NADPH2:quinone reductase, partial [Diplonema papillatum]